MNAVQTPMVTGRVRAYFAPVNRAAGAPVIFDPVQMGGFSLDAPPAPWIDLGWITGFTRKAAGKTGALEAGVPAASRMQVRQSLDATVSLRFKTWSKLTMALASGSEHMNLLSPAAGAPANGSGSRSSGAKTVLGGSTATTLLLNPGDEAGFPAGTMVAVDADYAGQTGFVGTPVSAAYVRGSTSVNNDPDYIRRVTFNVARVSGAAPGMLQLAVPLAAGTPDAGMKVQPITGFVDREGGSFYQEWSALFVLAGTQGERVLLHYPRLQALGSSQEEHTAFAAPFERVDLAGSFRALPVVDANDGQQVLCFRSFLPGPAMLP